MQESLGLNPDCFGKLRLFSSKKLRVHWKLVIRSSHILGVMKLGGIFSRFGYHVFCG